MKKIIIPGFIAMMPMLALAVDFKGLVKNIMDQIEILPYVIFFLAFVYFLLNVASYIMANDPKQIQEATKMITYGIIGLFVMVAVWGLVALIANTLGISDTGGSVTTPTLP